MLTPVLLSMSGRMRFSKLLVFFVVCFALIFMNTGILVWES